MTLLMIYVIAAVTAIAFAWLSLQITRLQPQSPGPWCSKCDYSLRGVSAWGKCPECGAELRTVTPRFYPRELGRWRFPALLTWTLSMLVLTACFERGVMLKYRPIGRHLMFIQTEQSHPYISSFRFNAYEYATDWIVGSCDDGPSDGIHLMRVDHPYRFSLTNYNRVGDNRGTWDQSSQALKYTIDGQETQIADGLTVAGLEQWAKDCGIDLNIEYHRAEVAEIVSLLRMRIYEETPYEPDRALLRMSMHTPVGSGRCYTPWYLLIPLVLLAGWIWWRGVKRIWEVKMPSV